MQRIRLPDGTAVWATSALEARVLYREIVTEQTYARHGITLPEGACVFDVGANIGLYAVHVARTVRGARIRAFEPIAATFAVLQRNLAEHAPGAHAVQAALAAAGGTAIFDVDPFSSITTTMTPAAVTGAAAASAGIGAWVTAGLLDLERADPRPLTRALAGGVRHPVSRPFVIAGGAVTGLAMELRKRMCRRRQACALRTVSAELAASGFASVDLVKIDVEGAEEEVLRGIADADWPRIRQLVIEVHDADGRRDRLAAGLAGRGYTVTQDREDWELHALMGISTIYAIRH
jgi:hypothetical protein